MRKDDLAMQKLSKMIKRERVQDKVMFKNIVVKKINKLNL